MTLDDGPATKATALRRVIAIGAGKRGVGRRPSPTISGPPWSRRGCDIPTAPAKIWSIGNRALGIVSGEAHCKRLHAFRAPRGMQGQEAEDV